MTDTTLARRNGPPLARAVAADPAMLNLSLQETLQLGDVLAQSGYFRDVKDAAQAVVKILYGRELGIGPASSLMAIHIIEGKPSPSAALMATLIKRSRRYNYRITVWTEQECRITFTERGDPCGEASFTLKEAQAAGVAGKDVWRKYPKAMLFSRAIGQGARAFCADVFGGAPVYAAEELGGAVVDEDTALGNLAPVDTATGEIIGEAHEVAADPDADYRTALYERLRDAGHALGMDPKDVNAAVKTEHGAAVKALAVDVLERVVETYERQAADVQGA